MKKLNYQLNKKTLSDRKKTEIKVFSDLESYEELMARPYFVALKNKVTYELKSYSFENKKILEIGAGTSQFLKIFEDKNAVTALDISADLLSKNKTKAKLVVGDAECLPFQDKSFDFIYVIGVLHHLENQKKALKEMKRVLKEGGKIFISEPYKWSLNLVYYLLRRLAIMFIGQKVYKKVSGCGTPEESFVCLKSVKEIFNSSYNLKVRKILPLRMPPIQFLESFFSLHLNSLLEKNPLLNHFGTIVFIDIEKE